MLNLPFIIVFKKTCDSTIVNLNLHYLAIDILFLTWVTSLVIFIQSFFFEQFVQVIRDGKGQTYQVVIGKHELKFLWYLRL